MSLAATEVFPSAERILAPTRDGALAGLHWRADEAPQLVFLHATGFCASAYRPMFELLNGRFEILALDLRGHGRTRLQADPTDFKSWTTYADDVLFALDATPAPASGRLLAGHSLGAVVATLASAGGARSDRLALIEPVATPMTVSTIARTPIWPLIAGRWPLVRRARSRRATFPSRAAAAESYRRKALFARWAPGALEGYLEDGLVDDAVGVRLACEPQWEAATFMAQSHNFWSAIKRVGAPISVLTARDPTSTVKPMAERALRRLGTAMTVETDASHLIPFERPDLAARFLAASSPATPTKR